MLSTKILLLVLILVLNFKDSEEFGFFKKIAKPFEAIGRSVRKVSSNVGKGLSKGLNVLGRLFNNIHKTVTYPIKRLLGLRKKNKIVVENKEASKDPNAPPNESFQQKILRLHNQFRSEEKSGTMLVSVCEVICGLLTYHYKFY